MLIYAKKDSSPVWTSCWSTFGAPQSHLFHSLVVCSIMLQSRIWRKFIFETVIWRKKRNTSILKLCRFLPFIFTVFTLYPKYYLGSYYFFSIKVEYYYLKVRNNTGLHNNKINFDLIIYLKPQNRSVMLLQIAH